MIAEAKDDEQRMKAFAPIQEMITFVQFANDECDYGMGYELGIDLFCYGSHVRLTHTHKSYSIKRSTLNLHTFIFIHIYIEVCVDVFFAVVFALYFISSTTVLSIQNGKY